MQYSPAASRRSLVSRSPNVVGHPLQRSAAIVALVVDYPANWLINDAGVPYHRVFTPDHAILCAYAVDGSRFQHLYPCARAGYPRVTHPSATRSQNLHFPKKSNECFVRLACVKHAASVHPEPGSNSHVKSFCPAEVRLAFEKQCPDLLFFKGCFFIAFFDSQNLSRFFVCFSYQCSLLLFSTACIFYHIFKSLSTTFLFFFVVSQTRQL